jgi:hypothetical protein
MKNTYEHEPGLFSRVMDKALSPLVGLTLIGGLTAAVVEHPSPPTPEEVIKGMDNTVEMIGAERAVRATIQRLDSQGNEFLIWKKTQVSDHTGPGEVVTDAMAKMAGKYGCKISNPQEITSETLKFTVRNAEECWSRLQPKGQ